MNIKGSISEDHGLAVLDEEDLQVLSVGISTGGIAEMRMAEANPDRHIIATTLDKKGVEDARGYIAESHFDKQIEVKYEDVSEPLPYAAHYFDYVYARLVLHYLSKGKLARTLIELKRVLKPGGKLYIVVRSAKCPDATREGVQFDPLTNLTSGSFIDEETGKTYSYSRFFHTEESISRYVAEAGFEVSYVKAYDEPLFKDFMHTKVSSKTDNVIELLAVNK